MKLIATIASVAITGYIAYCTYLQVGAVNTVLLYVAGILAGNIASSALDNENPNP